MKNIFLYVLSITCIQLLSIGKIKAQQLEGNLNFHTFADNREYTQEPQTIFGARFSPSAGILLDSLHRFRVGANVLYEFGAKEIKVAPIAYYEYQKLNWNFLMGVFPRYTLLASYPRVLLTDTLNYYRPNVEGMFMKYETKSFYQNVWIDWTSRQTNTEREAFLFGSSGNYKRGLFFLSNFFYMLHNSTPKIPNPNEHLEDNGAAVVKIGVDLSHKTILDSLTINVGGITSFERVRDFESKFRTPKGLLVEFHTQYKQFGITNSYYHGDGHKLIYGDQFYKHKNYNRTDFSWEPKIAKYVTCKLVFSLHFTETSVDNQQAFNLRYNLGARKKIKFLE